MCQPCLSRSANDLIEITRLEQGKLALQDGPVSVREAAMRASGGSSVVQIDIPEDLTARGDEARVEKILSALIDNALKYGRDPIRIRGTESDGRVVVTVTDDGEGIPPAEHDRIFELFYRIPGTRNTGSGIGLPLAKRLAEVQSGQLYHDPDGSGATFVLVLPRMPGAEATSTRSAARPARRST